MGLMIDPGVKSPETARLRNGVCLSLFHFAIASGDDPEAIAKWNNDKHTPFLNRAVSGLFTPGSIIKPIFATGALNEGILTPDTQIQSIGYIAIPNPYVEGQET